MLKLLNLIVYMGTFAKKKSSLVFTIFSFLMAGFIFLHPTEAAATDYWFNNAVNTDPATLGNYWLNAGQTVPAVELPDLSEDELTIVAGATYSNFGSTTVSIRGDATNEGTITGNAYFYDTSVNNNTVDLDATFWGDQSEDFGIIYGTRTRRYASNTTTTRNFFSDGNWIVMADQATVDISGAGYNLTTSFSRVAPGYFVGGNITAIGATFLDDTVNVLFSSSLNVGSVPEDEDFEVRVNNIVVVIEEINITGNKVVITTDTTITPDEYVEVSYEIGSQGIIQATNGLNPDPFSSFNATGRIPAGDAPVYSTLVGNKLYVSNNHSSSVTVINTLTNAVIATIPVGDFPELSTAVGNKLYVNNLTSNTVSVINVLTDTVIATIPVGDGPYFSTAVGDKIYVSNTGSNTVSVIDSTTDTVISTITVGNSPWYAGQVGTKLYVPNRTDSSVSVINTVTNTVSSTISLDSGNDAGTKALVIGSKVYIGEASAVAVIDSTTDTISSHIDTGDAPYFSCSVGTKAYIANRDSSSISVINTLTDTVSSTISVGADPTSCVVIGSRIYVTHDHTATAIEVIDTVTDTVTDTIPVGTKPFYATAAGDILYTSNNSTDDVSAINTTTVISKLPSLSSFSTTTSDGVYTIGQVIPITATFGQDLNPGSTMTVVLTTGDSVVLSSVSGNTLSGNYTVGAGDTTPDLSIRSISSASVSDTNGHTRTSYTLPSSQGDLVAENSFITRNLGDTKNIVIGSYQQTAVGDRPYQLSAAVTVNNIPYSYVANQGDDTVSVIRLLDHTVVETINVGSEPYGLAMAEVDGIMYIYVANTGSNNVSVINTATNTVAATITVGVRPYYVASLGTNIYVSNSQSHSVSVINAVTNAVTNTIAVGSYPRGIKAHGTDIYVSNYGDPNYSGGDTVSVINSLSNTVTTTIILPAHSRGARGLNVLGDSVYVTNFRSHNVSIIDTATKTVTATVNVGNGPRGVVGLNSKVYIENFDDGTISVIDTGTNTVSSTVDVGHSPSGLVTIDSNIYIARFQDGIVSIFNPLTNSLRSVHPVISNISVSGINSYNATINFTTDTQTEGTIDFGTSTAYGSQVDISELSTNHNITLSSLSSGTTYHYRISAEDSEGNITRSLNQTFNTASGGGGGGILITPTQTESNENDEGGENNNIVPDDSTELERENSPLDNSSKAGSKKRKGEKIFLAVEDKGRLWYEYPVTGERYEITVMGALRLFRAVALGITNKDINQIPVAETSTETSSLGQRVKNMFLLQVENKGQTWYVDQYGFRYFVTASTIIDMSRKLMIGILNERLEQMPIAQ